MQLPLTPPVVLAALLVTGATTAASHPAPDTTGTAVQDASQEVADVPADASVAVPLPSDVACPAYLGPQCDSVAHEQYATGQALAAMGLPGV